MLSGTVGEAEKVGGIVEIFILVVILVLAVVCLVLVSVVAYAHLVEKEIATLKQDQDVRIAKKHKYKPLVESFELPSMASYNSVDLNEEAKTYIENNLSKVSKKIIDMLWWSDYLSDSYADKVHRLDMKLKTRSAKIYLQHTIPKDKSILVVKKSYASGIDITKHTTESRSYNIADVQRMMSELAKVKPDRFTDTKPEVRYKIFKRDNFTCTKCHKTGPDVDLHVMLTENGLVTVCSDCYEHSV